MNALTSPTAAARAMRLALGSAAAAAAFIVAGCAAPQATQLTNALPFDEAVAQATDGLVGQTQKLPAFLAKIESKVAKKGVVLDPMLDSSTGQQTNATQLLERRVTERMRASSIQSRSCLSRARTSRRRNTC